MDTYIKMKKKTYPVRRLQHKILLALIGLIIALVLLGSVQVAGYTLEYIGALLSVILGASIAVFSLAMRKKGSVVGLYTSLVLIGAVLLIESLYEALIELVPYLRIIIIGTYLIVFFLVLVVTKEKSFVAMK